MRGYTGPGTRPGWIGALARVLAFVALLFVFQVVLAAGWQLLPQGIRGMPFLETTVTVVAALAAGAILLRGADGRAPAALGIGVSRMTLLHIGSGVLIGAAGLAVAAVALLATGALAYSAQEGSVPAWLAVVSAQAGTFALAALAEEAVFRGYAFQVVARFAGPVTATVLSAVLFALAHGANPSIGVFALINIFLAGVLLAIAYLRTLSLWFATAVHMGWNWAMASLFDLPVSGWTVFDTPLYSPAVGGPAWWSGAAFGPEGGLVGTIGFAVALLLVLQWRAVRPDPAIVAARPLVTGTEEDVDGE